MFSSHLGGCTLPPPSGPKSPEADRRVPQALFQGSWRLAIGPQILSLFVLTSAETRHRLPSVVGAPLRGPQPARCPSPGRPETILFAFEFPYLELFLSARCVRLERVESGGLPPRPPTCTHSRGAANEL